MAGEAGHETGATKLKKDRMRIKKHQKSYIVELEDGSA